MHPVEEFQVLETGVFFWHGYEPAVKADLFSLALRIGSELIFIDPISLSKDAMWELVGDAIPAGVVLTNANHARAAEDIREQFDIPIHLHEEVGDSCEIKNWRPLVGESGQVMGLDYLHLPGAPPGEIALFHSATKFLVIGDALINAESYGFSLLPKKYTSDFKLMQASTRRLLRFDFDKIAFAHGFPITSQARARLEQLLAS
jgi:hypothetical protein